MSINRHRTDHCYFDYFPVVFRFEDLALCDVHARKIANALHGIPADPSAARADLERLRGLVAAWVKAERAFYDGAASANYDHLRVALKAAEAALRAAVQEQE